MRSLSFLSRALRFLPVAASLFALSASMQLGAATPPEIGAKAPDFTLTNANGKQVRLSELTAQGPVALIVLRGYPGYQCPYCNRQAQDFVHNAQAFEQAGVRVVMVYPGPPQDLNARAAEFLQDKSFPAAFQMLLDPGYEFTNLYGLRWDAPHETAFPSTFLIDQRGVVFFEKISKEHAGRTTAAELLEALAKRR
jgi:thioredoxin-dependent peroxiredoxin